MFGPIHEPREMRSINVIKEDNGSAISSSCKMMERGKVFDSQYFRL
ncbi:MAG: hypothetical protein AB1733_02875 [Thermodesulfobacteriota bacterium]